MDRAATRLVYLLARSCLRRQNSRNSSCFSSYAEAVFFGLHSWIMERMCYALARSSALLTALRSTRCWPACHEVWLGGPTTVITSSTRGLRRRSRRRRGPPSICCFGDHGDNFVNTSPACRGGEGEEQKRQKGGRGRGESAGGLQGLGLRGRVT